MAQFSLEWRNTRALGLVVTVMEKASQDAKVIGDILMRGNEAGVATEYFRAAHNMLEWADAERPENVEIPA